MNQFYGNSAIWGIGVVEDISDPLSKGRVRVRIYGLHSQLRSELPNDYLPWSTVLASSSEPSHTSHARSLIGLLPGSLVFGVFLDGEDYQDFLVLGSFPGADSATPIQTETQSDWTSLYGSSNPEKIFNFFRDEQGELEIIAAGFTAAIATRLQDISIDQTKETPEGYGIGVWGSRDREKLRLFAIENNSLESDLRTQLLFFVKERRYTLSRSFTTTLGSAHVSQTETEAADVLWQNYYGKPVEESKDYRHKLALSALRGYGFSRDGTAAPFPDPISPRQETLGIIVQSREHFRNLLLGSSRTIESIVLHHSDTYENMNSDAFDIDRWHKEIALAQGSEGSIGYHFIILRDGRLQAGRPIDEVGAHAIGYNENSIGVCLIGGRVGSSENGGDERSSNTFTIPQWETLRSIVETFLIEIPGGALRGHSDTERERGFPNRRSDPEFDFQAWAASQFPRLINRLAPPPRASSFSEQQKTINESFGDLVDKSPRDPSLASIGKPATLTLSTADKASNIFKT